MILSQTIQGIWKCPLQKLWNFGHFIGQTINLLIEEITEILIDIENYS